MKLPKNSLTTPSSSGGETVRKVQVAGVKYFNASSRDEAEHLREEYDDLVILGNQQMELFMPLALQLFKSNGTNQWSSDDDPPKPQRDLDHLISQIQEHLFEKGRFERSVELGTALLSNNPKNEPADFIKRRSALLCNRFLDVGNIGADFEKETEALPDSEKLILRILPEIARAYDIELAIREKEAIADDLPRVQMKTTKGTVVFELYENEAPDTVGNFISLVERNFYNSLTFHRVIDRFMVQGGGMNEKNEKKPIGYTIYDEHKKKNIRLHYRGVTQHGQVLGTRLCQFPVFCMPGSVPGT